MEGLQGGRVSDEVDTGRLKNYQLKLLIQEQKSLQICDSQKSFNPLLFAIFLDGHEKGSLMLAATTLLPIYHSSNVRLTTKKREVQVEGITGTCFK